MTFRYIPNLISLLRILMVAPTIYCLLKGRYDVALILFAIAGISDGVDGYLARHYQWQSATGAVLDPLGDKLLMVSCYLVLGAQQILPIWLVIAVIARDIIIMSGVVFYHLYIEDIRMAPSWISKLNTALQVLLVVIVLYSLTQWPLASLLSNMIVTVFMSLVLITTVWSGADYCLVWGRKAWQIHREKQT